LRLAPEVSSLKLLRQGPCEVSLIFGQKVLAKSETKIVHLLDQAKPSKRLELYLPSPKKDQDKASPTKSAALSFDQPIKLSELKGQTLLFPVVKLAPNDSWRKLLHGRSTLPYSELQQLLKKKEEDSYLNPKFWPSALNFLANLFTPSLAQAAENGSERALSIAPQDIRAKVNLQGPESWPEKEALETRTDLPAAASATPEFDSSRFISEPVVPASSDEPKPEPLLPTDAKQAPQEVAPSLPASPKETKPTFPKNESPKAIEQDAAPFPKNESPKAIEQDAAPFPQNESPKVIEQDTAPFPKNETPSVLEEKPKTQSEPKAEVAKQAEDPNDPNTWDAKEADPRTEPSGLRGKATTEQEGLVHEKPKEEGAHQEEQKEREVIYVDEDGNPVEKPLDLKAMLEEIKELMEQKKYDDALELLGRAKEAPSIDAKTLEEVLYLISDCYWFRYERDLVAGLELVLTSTNEALNANLRSERVPDALLRLCLAHVGAGNLLDAEGYITAILRRFPNYPGTAIGLTNLAQAFLKKGRPDLAERFFSIVVDKYPESSQLKAASVGLIQAYYDQKNFDRAKLILDFVNKRWPRHYIDDPEFLLLQANLEKEFKQKEKQVQTLWQFFNLEPNNPRTLPIFLEMADIYLAAKNLPIANYLYQEIVKRGPTSPESITARLRLSEQGFYEVPLSFATMNALYGRGSKPPFPMVYAELAQMSKTYPDAINARLKLAMWYLWDKQYMEAMGKAAEFIDEYPEHPNANLAKDIIWKAFENELALAFSEENYLRILTLWNAFPLVRQ
ncbi:MAG: tetratricopeptide repeat protein, partial [Desulfovibrio sp.]|nr:tetratricopeptide repeat protein [Desulfovibrio sp.]